METLLKQSAPAMPLVMPQQYRRLYVRWRRRLAIMLEALVIRSRVIKKLLNFLRDYCPIVVTRRFAIVTRYDDVCEVLHNSQVFEVNYYKAGPDQIIAMRDDDNYQRDRRILKRARDRELSRIRPGVQATAEPLITQACRSRNLDLVAGYSRLIAINLINEILGLHIDPVRMMQWTRAVFRHVFANFTDDPLIAEEASHARSAMDLCIREQVSRQALGDASSGHGMVYSLLGEAGITPDRRPHEPLQDAERTHLEIRVSNFVGGLACAMAETLSTAICYTIDYLIDRPDLLNGAREAARMIDSDDSICQESGFDRLTHYVFEILRFTPEIPFLPRICVRNFVVARMTERARLVPGNTMMLAAISSAMFDPEKFPNPEKFCLERSLESYLHFGWSKHRCLGQDIARKAVPQAVAPLLCLEGLQRAPGRAGRIQFDGAFPNSMLLLVRK
jgi:cytochrome P450